MENIISDFLKDAENRRLFEQERVVLDVTEMICKIMAKRAMTKEALALHLGTSKSEITRMLNGDRNLTFKKVSDILHYLDCELVVSFKEQYR